MVAFAYTAFGLTGFGSTVIALSLLVHFFALKFAVPLLMLLATALVLLPALLGGAWLGNRLHAAVPAAAVVKAVYALLVIAGLLLLARSLPAL